MVTVYIPYGLLCIAVAIIIIVGLKKVRENKKTNRIIRNNERLENILSIIREKNEEDESTSK